MPGIRRFVILLPVFDHIRPFIIQVFLGSKMGPFASFVRDFIFELPCTRVVSYARLLCIAKTRILLRSIYFRII